MECIEIRKMLASFMDGELEDPIKKDLQAHIDKCPACRRHYESLSVLQEKLFDGLHEPVKSPDLTASIMAALPVRTKPVSRWLWAAGGAFAFAAVLILSQTQGNHDSKKQATAPPTVHNQRHIQSPVAQHEPEKPFYHMAEKPITGHRHLRKQSHRWKQPVCSMASADTSRHRMKNSHGINDESDSPMFSINMTRSQASVEGTVVRSRVVMTLSMGDVKVTQKKESVSIPLQANKEEAATERPPLRTLVKAPGQGLVIGI